MTNLRAFGVGDRAAVPDGRCTFTASSLAAAGVVHALLGLVCGRLKPGGWRRCVRGAFGDLCLGRPYTSRVWRALRMGAAGSQTCAGGGGGVMRQSGMNETHEEAAH